MKCLVVEPSPSVRRAVIRSLQSIPGVTLLASDDPSTVLAGIEPPLELVVIGWSAEDDLGLDLLRAVRRHPDFAETPVVVVTPRGSHLDVRTAVTAGATDYVLRPFTPGTLAERLARFAPATETPEREAA